MFGYGLGMRWTTLVPFVLLAACFSNFLEGPGDGSFDGIDSDGFGSTVWVVACPYVYFDEDRGVDVLMPGVVILSGDPSGDWDTTEGDRLRNFIPLLPINDHDEAVIHWHAHRPSGMDWHGIEISEIPDEDGEFQMVFSDPTDVRRSEECGPWGADYTTEDALEDGVLWQVNLITGSIFQH